ncbi:MAG: histidine--tRNA ligase [Betaproteobacteria bacterium]|nr:histidine--tRNA ligase [Betaproteobacteria bacterium]
MTQKLQAVRGMNDILPDAAEQWLAFEETIRTWLHRYGYRNIRMPLLEHTSLFRRAIGEVTDIVEKEMYSFVDDLNGEHLTLRPEGTASTVRAAMEHNLLYDAPRRLWYIGPMFRHERPQKGRYRQFHQVGVEALGYAGPDMDAELLVMCARLWRDLGLSDIKLRLNSLGSLPERMAHREALVAYLRERRDELDGDGTRRLETNPLRVLDSKNPAMQSVIDGAPRLLDFLGDVSLAHFDAVKRTLDDAGIAYSIDPRLVRGLDYYNLTVFEWVTDRLGAQGTVCGGGRYDGLFEQIGGKPAPAAGFAMGIERLLDLIEQAGRVAKHPGPDVYIVHQGDAAQKLAFSVAEQLRDAAIATTLHCGGGSFKSQMKKADSSRAAVAVIIGEDEVAAGEVTVKPLRLDTPQQRVPRAALASSVGAVIGRSMIGQHSI